jgi:hypothetical protein
LQARQKNFFAQICPCFLRFANFGQIPDIRYRLFVRMVGFNFQQLIPVPVGDAFPCIFRIVSGLSSRQSLLKPATGHTYRLHSGGASAALAAPN